MMSWASAADFTEVATIQYRGKIMTMVIKTATTVMT